MSASQAGRTRSFPAMVLAAALSAAASAKEAPKPAPPVKDPVAEEAKKTCALGTNLLWATYKQDFDRAANAYRPVMQALEGRLRKISSEDREAMKRGLKDLVAKKLHRSTADSPYLGTPKTRCKTSDVKQNGAQMFLITYDQASQISGSVEVGGYACLVDLRQSVSRVDEDVTFLYFKKDGTLVYDKYLLDRQALKVEVPLANTLEEQLQAMKASVRASLPSWESVFKAKFGGNCPFEDRTQSLLGQMGVLPPQPKTEKADKGGKDAEKGAKPGAQPAAGAKAAK